MDEVRRRKFRMMEIVNQGWRRQTVTDRRVRNGGGRTLRMYDVQVRDRALRLEAVESFCRWRK